MAATLYVRQKQRAIVEFLYCENETMGNIHKRFRNVYGDDAVDRSTVSRWAHTFSGESGHANIRDSPRTGSSHTAQTPDNVQRVNDMVLEDKRVTLKEMSIELGIGEASVCRILKQLGLKKLCKVGSEHNDRCPQRNPLTPYSPGAAPSDYLLFGKLKESHRGTRLKDVDALITAAKRSLRDYVEK
jgi:transposase